VEDILLLLAAPFVAAIVFVGMHTWLGLQVLRRNVIFADLALAQLAALGGTVAVAAGHAPNTPASIAYSLAAALIGAGLLTASRGVAARLSQEAMIGIVYVVATAATVLVVDRSPQGAEHVKRMLVGSILTVQWLDVLKLAGLYGVIGVVHALTRRSLLRVATEHRVGPTLLWDFVFYGSFAVVVTSSVAHAGVLLVFCFLIIPAVIGSYVATAVSLALAIGWVTGALATLAGFAASVAWDLPTGPAMVVAFAVVLVSALPIKAVADARRDAPGASRAALLRVVQLGLIVVAVQGVWLIAAPHADQPVLAAFERLTGLVPERFLTPGERRTYEEAATTERRNRDVVEALRMRERNARSKGDGLTDEDLRRIASYQQTFNEMGRGERFVQDHLRARARERERWWIGVPSLLVAAVGLFLTSWRHRDGK
jgi:zinc/manganese transport system permease protein